MCGIAINIRAAVAWVLWTKTANEGCPDRSGHSAEDRPCCPTAGQTIGLSRVGEANSKNQKGHLRTYEARPRRCLMHGCCYFRHPLCHSSTLASNAPRLRLRAAMHRRPSSRLTCVLETIQYTADMLPCGYSHNLLRRIECLGN
jgi:hypothetical protein